MRKLLIATTNPGKFLEFKEIFKELELGIDLVSLKDLGISQRLEETGKNFEENAIQKAKFYYNLSEFSTLVDDGGLEIDYLNGEPGVRSRRWPSFAQATEGKPGYEASDEELIQMTLEKLRGVPRDRRGAQLRTIIALIFPPRLRSGQAGDKKVHTFEGVLRGRIAEAPTTERIAGYPFRSIFIPENQEKYLGELSLVAHRKQAIEKAMPIIKKYLC